MPTANPALYYDADNKEDELRRPFLTLEEEEGQELKATTVSASLTPTDKDPEETNESLARRTLRATASFLYSQAKELAAIIGSAAFTTAAFVFAYRFAAPIFTMAVGLVFPGAIVPIQLMNSIYGVNNLLLDVALAAAYTAINKAIPGMFFKDASKSVSDALRKKWDLKNPPAADASLWEKAKFQFKDKVADVAGLLAGFANVVVGVAKVYLVAHAVLRGLTGNWTAVPEAHRQNPLNMVKDLVVFAASMLFTKELIETFGKWGKQAGEDTFDAAANGTTYVLNTASTYAYDAATTATKYATSAGNSVIAQAKSAASNISYLGTKARNMCWGCPSQAQSVDFAAIRSGNTDPAAEYSPPSAQNKI